MDLRDKILQWFIDQEKGMDSQPIAERVGCTEGELLQAVEDINRYKWIIVGKGSRNSRAYLSVRKAEIPAIKKFLEQRGFTRLRQAADRADQLQSQKLQLELGTLRLQMDSLKRSVRDNKTTRLISVLAILIAAATLIFEIYKFYHS